MEEKKRHLLTKGTYNLLELAGLKELVLNGVNGKVKDGPRDYSRDPYEIRADVNNMRDLATRLSNIPPTVLRDFLSQGRMFSFSIIWKRNLHFFFLFFFFQLFVLFLSAN